MSDQPQVQAPDLSAQSGIAAGEGYVPVNMIGNLLRADRSLSFRYINTVAAANISVSNSKVSEDNSPVPSDRVYFRYNHFSNAESVSGLSLAQILAQGSFAAPGVTKHYDRDLYTFGFEKTFLDGLLSAELRVPFSTGLASNLNLNTRQLGSVGSDGFPIPTPQATLGHEDTEFGDMLLILKAALVRNQDWTISVGSAFGFPTAPDSRISTRDFAGFGSLTDITATRTQDFVIKNETWSASPFVALLMTPTDRFFAQGFLEFDFPLNKDGIRFSERIRDLSTGLDHAFGPGPGLAPPFTVTDSVRDQILMHVDVGAGYWLIRNPDASWLTGVAPTLELHLTSTLQDAEIATLPGTRAVSPTNLPEPGPQVGNQRNRVDILDMTAGTTFVLGDRTTVATAVSFPLKHGDDRTFDWEFQLQVNFYFGGERSSAAMFGR